MYLFFIMPIICFSDAIAMLYGVLRRSRFQIIFHLLEKSALAILVCVFSLGGATIGAITGAIQGNTTETGVVRGFSVGAVAGAITGVHLLELVTNGEPFSKVALLQSLIDGKIFTEWVCPAMLKAYQWQASAADYNDFMEISDVFDVQTSKGLSQPLINTLPVHVLAKSCRETTCAICLQDLRKGESCKLLPRCAHFFHLQCIDEWLMKQGTCPVCRNDV